MVRFKIFSNEKNIRYGMSTKKDGSMYDGKKIIKKHVIAFFKNKGINYSDTVFLEQVHDNNVVDVDHSGLFPKADGVITSKKNLFLCIKTADCLPIIFFDPVNSFVSIVHAGYKGILQGIIQNSIAKYRKNDRVNLLKVAIGPGICGKCYTVSEKRFLDFRKKFSHCYDMHVNKSYEYSIDLKKIVKSILREKGVKENNIEISPICTYENNSFFSYRRDKGKEFGEFITYVGII